MIGEPVNYFAGANGVALPVSFAEALARKGRSTCAWTRMPATRRSGNDLVRLSVSDRINRRPGEVMLLSFSGWTPELQEITFVKMARSASGISLKKAKRLLEQITSTYCVSVSCSRVESISELAGQLARLGVVCSRRGGTLLITALRAGWDVERTSTLLANAACHSSFDDPMARLQSLVPIELECSNPEAAEALVRKAESVGIVVACRSGGP